MTFHIKEIHCFSSYPLLAAGENPFGSLALTAMLPPGLGPRFPKGPRSGFRCGCVGRPGASAARGNRGHVWALGAAPALRRRGTAGVTAPASRPLKLCSPRGKPMDLHPLSAKKKKKIPLPLFFFFFPNFFLEDILQPY